MQPQKIADVIQLLEPPQEVVEAHSIHMIKMVKIHLYSDKLLSVERVTSCDKANDTDFFNPKGRAATSVFVFHAMQITRYSVVICNQRNH